MRTIKRVVPRPPIKGVGHGINPKTGTLFCGKEFAVIRDGTGLFPHDCKQCLAKAKKLGLLDANPPPH